MRQQYSVLMYNSETWILKQTQENRLWVFEMSCLRRITGVTCRDRIRNKEVCDRNGILQDIANCIQQRRMQYFGHVQRMDQTRYPKLELYGYVHETRKQGRPKKRWIDMVKDECKQRDLDIHQATEMTQHRSARRSLVKAYACICIANKSILVYV